MTMFQLRQLVWKYWTESGREENVP